MSRDKIRETIAVLKAQMRLIDMPLPDGKRGGKQTYLHPAAKVPTSREDC
jgi:hypothetical protein